MLKDGSVFEGDLYGKRNAVGEVVFTTGMSGYQETMTDPSFCDQIVVLTYPLVGNYGCCQMFNQSDKCWYQGLIVSELCDEPSNWRCEESLPAFLERNDIPILTGVDTRAITRIIRRHGTLAGVIVPADMPQTEIDKLLAAPDVHDQVAKVTTKEVYTMGKGKYHVAVLDLGIKQHILTSLASFGCKLTVFPAFTSAETILALLIIVYRLRNNLFHGEKWNYYFKDQLGNFTHASAILMRTVELFAVKGLLTSPE